MTGLLVGIIVALVAVLAGDMFAVRRAADAALATSITALTAALQPHVLKLYRGPDPTEMPVDETWSFDQLLIDVIGRARGWHRARQLRLALVQLRIDLRNAVADHDRTRIIAAVWAIREITVAWRLSPQAFYASHTKTLATVRRLGAEHATKAPEL